MAALTTNERMSAMGMRMRSLVVMPDPGASFSNGDYPHVLGLFRGAVPDPADPAHAPFPDPSVRSYTPVLSIRKGVIK
jgi:hypothetical protein